MTLRPPFKLPALQYRQGFTLVEMLVGLVILSILTLAFTQVFGSSLRASSEINARNELVYEGQIAQQLVAARLQSAFHVYTGTGSNPNPMQLTAGGDTTRNTVRNGAGQNWIVGTDPFVAMLLPPKEKGSCSSSRLNSCFTFYAYYTMRRGYFIEKAEKWAPPEDPNNANAWVLMEYVANIVDNVDRITNQVASPPLPGTAFGTNYVGGRSGRMLADFVQPLGVAPYNRIFTVDGTNRFVDINLRFQQNRVGKTLTAPGGTAPLTTRVFPRNWTQ